MGQNPSRAVRVGSAIVYALLALTVLFGIAMGSLDVAMNAHGVAVESRYGRPILASFHAAHPGVSLSVVEAGSRDLVDRLASGDLDLALVILPLPREELFDTLPLLREELVLAVAKRHPLATRKTVRVGELRGVPLVMFRDGYDLRSATVAACEQAGFHPTFAIEGAEMDGVLRMAAAGVGVAVVPRMVVEKGGPLVAVRLVQPTLTRSVGVAFRRDRHRARSADAFVAQLREFL